MENKRKLLVSFSGGETSAFMAQWIKNHLEDKVYDRVVYVFANTGLENEQTLEFVERCSKYWKMDVQWVEASVNTDRGYGTGYWLTDFRNAKRNGEPFESVIKKYGIPNQAGPHCTRELKQVPISKFGRDWFDGEKYDTAIGIRADEADRMNPKYKENGYVYPLIHERMIPATKPMINFYWRGMPFRLNLKSYQGNCVTCWKKSDPKLFKIANENPSAFDFMNRMEEQYGWVNTKGREDYTFFRGHRSAKDILEQAKQFDGIVRDDSQNFTVQLNLDLIGGDSCEVFSECGE